MEIDVVHHADTEPLSRRPTRTPKVDWSIPLDDSALHLPEPFLPLFGTAAWRDMTLPERHRYSRHECAAFLATTVWLENILMALVLRQLFRTSPGDPSHHFLLEEVADECRHSDMFAEYVRRAGTPAYRPTLRLRLPGSVVRAAPDPVVSFIAVLAGEELVDTANRATARSTAVHPVSRQIARVHVVEEAAHVSYGRAFVADAWPRLNPFRKAMVAAAAPMVAFGIADCLVNPYVYTTLGIRGGYGMALTNQRHHRRIAASFARFTAFLDHVGVINAASRPVWRNLGLLEEQTGPLEAPG